MAKRPAAQANADLLRVIDGSNGQELCEMYLKQVQAAEGKR